MKLSIKINNLYKEYRLGVIGSGTLYRDIQSFWAKINKRPDPNSIINSNTQNKKNKRFLALKDINLEIEKGTVVGLIGPNGAGKSTLLKILSKITSPSKGSISYNGRLASLLEVGTGFHPELTGRENIFLNASINGMSISETNSKLQDIVKFSGVGVHLDTPVKRYSSGMLVRLGFSVAAFLDPDILLIDEVLAVGDASFRNKAIDKIKNITKDKRKTIIFVSHNLDSVAQLCTKSILLDEGKIIKYDDTSKVIDTYLNLSNVNSYSYIGKKSFDFKNQKKAYIKSICSKNQNNDILNNFKISENFMIEVNYDVFTEGSYAISLEFYDTKDNLLFLSFDDSVKTNWNEQKIKKKGSYRVTLKLGKNLFEPGSIRISINLINPPLPGNLQIDKQDRNFSIILDEDIDNYATARGHYPFFWGKPILRPKIETITVYEK